MAIVFDHLDKPTCCGMVLWPSLVIYCPLCGKRYLGKDIAHEMRERRQAKLQKSGVSDE